MTTSQRNWFAGISLLVGIPICAGFIVALFGSKAGEIAAAIGGVIGGAIGAGGAAFSVYYLMSMQRADETEKTTRAVLTEVAVLSKYIIGHLGLCEMIQHGLKFPKANLPTALLMPEPTIYRAVAGRVSRLPRATQVVNFYTRLSEIHGIAAVIVSAPPLDGDITGNDIKALADLLILQCQVAHALLSNIESDAASEAVLADGLRQSMLVALDQQIKQAKQFFPDAESYGQEVEKGRV